MASFSHDNISPLLGIYHQFLAFWLRVYLLHDGSDAVEWEGGELVLLEEVVEVLFEHLEHQAGVTLVLEALEGAHEVELLGVFVRETGEDRDLYNYFFCTSFALLIFQLWQYLCFKIASVHWKFFGDIDLSFHLKKICDLVGKFLKLIWTDK